MRRGVVLGSLGWAALWCVFCAASAAAPKPKASDTAPAKPVAVKSSAKSAAKSDAAKNSAAKSAAGKSVAAVFKAGAATSNITPPLGRDIIGGFMPFPATQVHDELSVRCLVLDDGKTRLALVVCDLLGVHYRVSEEARKLIKQQIGLPPEQVLICATHTHSACSALGKNRTKFEEPLDEYQRFVARRIADAVQCAAGRLRPAQIAFGTASAPEHVFNRRWKKKPGTIPLNPFGEQDKVQMNPSSGSPDLVEPAGPTDPTISFFAVREPSGRPLAVFSSYSLHYVGGVGPAHISADYYAMYCDRLMQLLQADRQDPPFVAMMANGTSGDVNNVNFRTPRPDRGAYVQMRAVADDVAGKVHHAMANLQYRDHVTLAACYREPPLATRRPSEEQVRKAKQRLVEHPRQPGKLDLASLYAERTIALADFPATVPVPLQVFRIGDVCLGTMPSEVFCEIGLEFKSRSPIQPAFLVSLSHGYLGYLPTPKHHELGGYETWLGSNRLEKQASVKMLDALIEMANEVREKKP